MKTKDPVCGMLIERVSAAGSADYMGVTYHFCSQACLNNFKSDPEKFMAWPEKRK